MPKEQGTQTKQVDFLLYLPETYGGDPVCRWLLIFYLYGSGECGMDLSLLLDQPLPENLAIQADFPFIVVSPQTQWLGPRLCRSGIDPMAAGTAHALNDGGDYETHQKGEPSAYRL